MADTEQDRISRLEKRLDREKNARAQAETLLEEKSREIYELNMKLTQNARLMLEVIAHANDAVIITDANIEEGPKIVYVNKAFTRMTGYEPEEVLGKSPKMLQGPDTDKTTTREIGQSLRQGKPFKGELKNYSKDGIPYWLDISIVPILDENRQITHYAAIERDSTERKAFEKSLTINREAAEVAGRAKDDFLANMSHELRTPMNGIIGLSELLLDHGLDSDQLELVEAVNNSSRNLLILLNDVLDLSKIEAGELTLERISFDVRSMIEQTFDLLKPIASRKSVSLESSISALLPTYLHGDPARIQQILNNLVGNAIKFTEAGCVRIDVSSRKVDAENIILQIRVEDTGIGIPEEKHDMIFNKFTQADVSTARRYGGTGLGLAITKELVEMMYGEIGFDSELGKGTTFYVELPLMIAKANFNQTASKESATDESGINKNISILVVDDHPVNLLFMRKVLKKIGFEWADEAVSGTEAIELYKAHKYDLIFMDCQMPEMDGFEASAIIREIEDFTNQTKIIAVTADAMKGARERCMDAGMNDYISKPIDTEKLMAVIKTWVPNQSVTSDTKSFEIRAVVPPGNSEPQYILVDWERLSMFTDGDAEEEKALVALFTNYSEETLEVLKGVAYDPGVDASDVWTKAAHKLKGSAANFGAAKLADLCFDAEKYQGLEDAVRQDLFEKIHVAYQETTAEIFRHMQARSAA